MVQTGWATRVSLTAIVVAGTASAAQDVPLRSGVAEMPRLPAAMADRPAALKAAMGSAVPSQRFLMQLDAPLTPARRRALVQAGIRLEGYVAAETYAVRLAGVDRASIASLPFVQSVRPFEATWKLSPSINRRPLLTAERRAMRDRGEMLVQIHLFPETTDVERDALLDQINARPGSSVVSSIDVGGVPTIVARMLQAESAWLASISDVQFVEEAPDITLRTADARWAVQSNIAGMTPLWDNGLTGAGQVLAVCDSGLDATHCAFAMPGKIVAYNAVATSSSHGTSVASIAVGNPDDGDDETFENPSLLGNAYDAGLVFSLIPSYTFDTITTVLETQSGPGQGARVHNNSWGDDGTDAYTGLARAIDAFCWENEDDVVVFATSNSANLQSPENAKNAIAVAASQNVPNQSIHCFGGRGLTDDGRIKPDVMAPGCSIDAAGGGACSTFSNSGTSFAAPMISGIAALTRQYYMEGYYPTGAPVGADGFTPSGALIKATIINAGQGGTTSSYPDDRSGWGRVVADEALFFNPGNGGGSTADTRGLVIRDLRNADGLTTGSAVEHTIEVTGTAEPLRITLVWTDAPGAPGVEDAWVNDLDLQVIAPGDVTYLGNNFIGEESAPGGSPDFRNNVEQVRLATPDTGTWRVRISGAAVRQGTQGYALVVTGQVSDVPDGMTVVTSQRPTELGPPPGNATFDVTILPGDDALVEGSPMLHYRYAEPAFTAVPLTHVEGSVFQAQLPDFPCGYTLEYFVSAEGTTSGLVSSPPSGGAYHLVRGTPTTTTAAFFDFESGTPAGWTMNGLWHVTSNCDPGPGCGEGSWLYFGQSGPCNYNVGLGAAMGNAQSSPILLPGINGPGARATLRYCTAIDTENVSRFDRGVLSVTGAGILDEPPQTGAQWTTREVELNEFGGGLVRLLWSFDSEDGFANDFTGWHVDNVEILHTTLDCPDACPGDTDDDKQVALSDFAALARNYGDLGPVVRWQGDVDIDGDVDMDDFTLLAGQFGLQCE
jgi:hypothetical protein